MLIRRRFSGELKSADGEPKTFLREEGAYSVNKRNELTWTITLRPGEEQSCNTATTCWWRTNRCNCQVDDDKLIERSKLHAAPDGPHSGFARVAVHCSGPGR